VETKNQNIRIRFGSSLAISLELLLAAAILVQSSYLPGDDIGKLAAIAVLRTVPNFSLKES
jgi:uncharacterized membrane protein